MICLPVSFLFRHQADDFADDRVIPSVQPLPGDVPRERAAELEVLPGDGMVRQPALGRFQPGIMQFAQPVPEKRAIPVFLPGLDHRHRVREISERQPHTPQRGREPFPVAGFQEAQDIRRRAEAGSTALRLARGAPAFHGLPARLPDDAL